VIREKSALYYSQNNEGPFIKEVVLRIKADSLYVDDHSFIFSDLNRIAFAEPGKLSPGDPFHHGSETVHYRLVYSREDSASWHIFFPPDSIYEKNSGVAKYLLRIRHLLVEEKNISRNPLVFGNFLKFNLAKLIHLEFSISYERKIAKKASLEIETGYTVGIRDADAHRTFNYPVYNYNGITLLASSKLYCISNRTYLAAGFQYRYLWFNGVRTNYPGKDAEGSVLQDQVRNDYGLSLRIGCMKRNGHFIVDWYAGAGCKIVDIDWVSLGYFPNSDSKAYHAYASPESNHTVKFEPIINFGVKIGGCF
jgi:hypothetical protein